MTLNLNGKVFRSISNTDNGEVGSDTVFFYHQQGRHVWAEYSGGAVIKGHLVAIMQDNGVLHMHYHHINSSHKIMLDECVSTPVINKDGKIIFQEQWQWLNGDKSAGFSKIIEQ